VLTYAQAATPSIVATVVVPSTAPSISAITQDEVDKLLASFSQKFTESLGSSMTIQALEQQVQQTSGEIKQVQNAFQEKLHLVASSVDSLSAKVDTQHEHMNSTVESLNITISRQNLVIACIQQEFKATMADLYQKLHLAPPTFNNQGASQLAASPATQPDAYPLAQQLGGAGS
jgi:exonuclease VII large subunit